MADIDAAGSHDLHDAGADIKQDQEVQIVMLTVFRKNDRMVKASGQVVKGHFVHEGTTWQSHSNIKMLQTSDSVITQELACRVLAVIHEDKGEHPDYNLSIREKEILSLLVDGWSYKEIAKQLFISLETVRTHVRHVYEKLKVRSKSQAVGKALRERVCS